MMLRPATQAFVSLPLNHGRGQESPQIPSERDRPATRYQLGLNIALPAQWRCSSSDSRNEHVLFEAVSFLLADILADFLIELSPALPWPVFRKLRRHARADPRNQREFILRPRVQIDRHEGLAVELRRLRLR